MAFTAVVLPLPDAPYMSVDLRDDAARPRRSTVWSESTSGPRACRMSSRANSAPAADCAWIGSTPRSLSVVGSVKSGAWLEMVVVIEISRSVGRPVDQFDQRQW